MSVDMMKNDVVLMKVSPPIDFSKDAAPIQLASEDYVVPRGKDLRVIGWGSTSEGGGATYELRSVLLHTADSGECARAYGDAWGTAMKFRNLICAYGSHGGICEGDSGGPLVIQGDIQVGIVFGGAKCADYRYPGIYQDFAHYRHWFGTHFNQF